MELPHYKLLPTLDLVQRKNLGEIHIASYTENLSFLNSTTTDVNIFQIKERVAGQTLSRCSLAPTSL